jgi:hypothetical protein
VSDATVALVEIAAATGRDADDLGREAFAVGLSVLDDWQGRPSLSVAEARSLVSGEARRIADHEHEQRELARRADQWLRDRDQVTERAWQNAMAGQPSTPATRNAAREARVKAGRDFERHCPAELRRRVWVVYHNRWDEVEAPLTGKIKDKIRPPKPSTTDREVL